MESRYALREIEGAIGRDCGRLEDGRRASFRHTFLHRKSRMDFLERRDEIAFLSTSLAATASLASNPRVDVDRAVELVADSRRALFRSVFPYADAAREERPKDYDDYSEYFDELDRIEKEADTGQNDIISEEK